MSALPEVKEMNFLHPSLIVSLEMENLEAILCRDRLSRMYPIQNFRGLREHGLFDRINKLRISAEERVEIENRLLALNRLPGKVTTKKVLAIGLGKVPSEYQVRAFRELVKYKARQLKKQK